MIRIQLRASPLAIVLAGVHLAGNPAANSDFAKTVEVQEMACVAGELTGALARISPRRLGCGPSR